MIENYLYGGDQLKIDWRTSFPQQTWGTHVYAFSLMEYPNLIDKYNYILSAEELYKSQRFHRKKDAQSYLLARILCKLLLSKYNNLEIEEIELEAGVNKKPFVKIQEDSKLRMHFFNWAHSKDKLVIAFSENETGIDIEQICEFDYDSILQTTFSKHEIDFLKSSGDLLTSFFILWTRKEAVLKAIGTGLSDKLSAIEVLNERYRVNAETNYQMRSWLDEDDYAATVCVQESKEPGTKFFKLRPEFFL